MNVILLNLKNLLNKYNIVIKRIVYGKLMTSFDMKGFSVTLMVKDKIENIIMTSLYSKISNGAWNIVEGNLNLDNVEPRIVHTKTPIKENSKVILILQIA
jgi:hypothetical protein